MASAIISFNLWFGMVEYGEVGFGDVECSGVRFARVR